MTTDVAKKKGDFSGLRVAAFESRMQMEMTRLIENLGGRATVAPSMREVPIEENKEVFQFGELLVKGQIDMLILFTGVGTRRLFKILTTKYPIEEIKAALEKLTVVARGPKPVKALSEIHLKPNITIPEPNTWREILKTLDAQKPIEKLTVAVQEYGESNRLFLNELKARDAQIISVPVYRSELPLDLIPLKELLQKILHGDVDVYLFTNATQVEHVMALAREAGVAQEFRRMLRLGAVASVGPTCSEALERYGLSVDIEPERPMMGALVAAAAFKAEQVLRAKKERSVDVQFARSGISRKGDVLYESLFLKACRREKTERTPVWLMRQAGRYMKEYRELRAKVSFLELCKNSDLASEVTVDAAHRLDVDAAIIFSDILLILEPLGFQLSYLKDEGPEIGNPLRSENQLKDIKDPEPEESLLFVYDAVRKTRKALKPDIPLIGFCGAPFTLASYCIEGKGSRNFIETKSLMHKDLTLWHAFMDKLTEALIRYLNAQVSAGAQAVQVFDSWVGCLSPEDFRTYVLPYTKKLIQGVQPGIPVINFGTQTAGFLPLLKQTGGDVIGIDWRMELDEAWDILGDVAIQGNLDPTVLLSPVDTIRSQAKRILTQASGRPGHIFNLGHGVLPQTPIENVHELIKTVKEYRA